MSQTEGVIVCLFLKDHIDNVRKRGIADMDSAMALSKLFLTPERDQEDNKIGELFGCFPRNARTLAGKAFPLSADFACDRKNKRRKRLTFPKMRI